MANLSTLIGSTITPATSVTTQAFGNAGTVGSSLNYARQDHIHGMPVASITSSGLTATDNTIPVGTGSGIELATLGAGLSYDDTNNIIYSPFRVALLPGSFNLIGATTEPLLAATDGTNFDYPVLQYIDGATELNAFFHIPSKFTSFYQGGNIKIDVDFLLVGATLTNTHTIIMGVGLIEVNDAAAFDTAPPTSSTGWNTATYTLGASETTLYKHTITVTITADSSISAGQNWIGRLQRKTGTDTSVAAAYVTGITVYEA